MNGKVPTMIAFLLALLLSAFPVQGHHHGHPADTGGFVPIMSTGAQPADTGGFVPI
jgi:hypothetical protein